MKVSQLGLIQKKLNNIDSQYPVQDMLIQTGQISQFASGIYAYGTIPYLVEKNINNIICDVFSKYNYAEVSLPRLQPESLWKESGRLQKYIDDGVMLQVITDKNNFCLAPTAEEAVVAFAKPRLTSYKDLPATYFQIGEKFRNELRNRGFLLRGKAFSMMDAYSFGKNFEDLDIEYANMKKAYMEIFNQLGLEVIAVAADNGDMGGKKSEEFMCISSIGEDTILVDENTGQAFNTELLERADYKEYLKESYGINDVSTLVEKKAVELGHIFQLGEAYSKSMNATYTDENGKHKHYVMGCYGIGVSRTLAMVYENNSIKNNSKFEGVALPVNLSPYLVYIVPNLEDINKSKKAQEMYEDLVSKGVGALIDDRKDVRFMSKVKDSKVTGTPYVAIFGRALEEGRVEIENNITGEKTSVALEDFVNSFSNLNQVRKENKSLEYILDRKA